MRLAELRREVGGPAQTTLRGNLDTLLDMGALEKVRGNGRANMADNALTPLGREMLCVADAVDTWLARAPGGPLQLESEPGKAAIKALVNGWDSTMLRALAVRPFTLTELDNLISSFSYPALERRSGGDAPCRPCHAGARKRRRHPVCGCRVAAYGDGAAAGCDALRASPLPTETAPLARIDIETVMLLALPLVALPAGADGVAQLAVHGGNGSGRRSAGIRLTAENGRIVACTSKLEARPESWVGGSAVHWLDALVEGGSDQLEVCGDRTITLGVVDNLHRALFFEAHLARIYAMHESAHANFRAVRTLQAKTQTLPNSSDSATSMQRFIDWSRGT